MTVEEAAAELERLAVERVSRGGDMWQSNWDVVWFQFRTTHQDIVDVLGRLLAEHTYWATWREAIAERMECAPPEPHSRECLLKWTEEGWVGEVVDGGVKMRDADIGDLRYEENETHVECAMEDRHRCRARVIWRWDGEHLPRRTRA